MISIEPWPSYDDQLRAWWNVRIEAGRGNFTLSWTSAGAGRWALSGELRRLQRSNKRLLFRAEQLVRSTFEGVTEKSQNVTPERDKGRDIERDASRAPVFSSGKECHGVTVRDSDNRDVTGRRDSDIPGLGAGTSPSHLRRDQSGESLA